MAVKKIKFRVQPIVLRFYGLTDEQFAKTLDGFVDKSKGESIISVQVVDTSPRRVGSGIPLMSDWVVVAMKLQVVDEVG